MQNVQIELIQIMQLVRKQSLCTNYNKCKIKLNEINNTKIKKSKLSMQPICISNIIR